MGPGDVRQRPVRARPRPHAAALEGGGDLRGRKVAAFVIGVAHLDHVTNVSKITFINVLGDKMNLTVRLGNQFSESSTC